MASVQRMRLNLLSIDGGSSGLPALYIIDEILSRLAFDLESSEELMAWRHFDMMIGTGPGGLVVILVGRLRLPLSRAIEAYMKLEAVMPKKPARDAQERSQNSAAFRMTFLEVLKEAGFEADTPMIDETMPKVILCTSNTANVSVIHPIRSYRARCAISPSCTVIQAACACIASLDSFDSVTIGVGHKRAVLIDAIAVSANPARELLREAQDVFGEDAEVASFVSVGAGKGSVKALLEYEQEGGNVGISRGVAMCEQVHEDLQGRLQETTIYYRFNVGHEIEIRPDIVLAHVSAYLRQKVTSSRVDSAVKSIHRRLTGVKLHDIISVKMIEMALKPRPSLVDNFVGREDVLEAMRRTHLTQRPTNSRRPAITVLSGLGGAGKTQTALKFALEFEERYPNIPVYFINAGAEGTLKADLESLIRSCGAEYHSSSHQDALTWLATKLKDWLVIMDNADDPSFRLVPYIPVSAHGNVIITTRNANHALLAPKSSHHLEHLSTEDAIDLILRASGNEDTEINRALARAIVEELGCLPLALAQAAGYIFVHRCLPRYLNIYRASQKQLLELETELPDGYQTSVATTIIMSLERLPLAAQNMMRLFAHLDCTSISQDIIIKSAVRKFKKVVRTTESQLLPETLEQASALERVFCPTGSWLESDFNKLISQCMQYSLLRVTTRGDVQFYSMHILVQSYLRSISAPVQGYPASRLIIRLLGSSVTCSQDHAYLAFNRLLLPHIRQIRREYVAEAGDHYTCGHVMQRAGDNQLAVFYLKQSVEMWKGTLGEEHENTLWAMIGLAVSYGTIGRIREAVELEERVLEVQMRTLGREHGDTLMVEGYLAVSYMELGRYEEAVKLGEQVLDVRRRVFGPDGADAVRTMGNLALSYKHLGRNQEALELEEQALEIWKRTLGLEDPDTLRAMGNLAESYKIVGRKHKALELSLEALEMQKRVMGADHPSTLSSMRIRLDILRDLGTVNQLQDLLRVAMPAHKKVLGIDHRRTIWLRKEFATELALLDTKKRSELSRGHEVYFYYSFILVVLVLLVAYLN